MLPCGVGPGPTDCAPRPLRPHPFHPDIQVTSGLSQPVPLPRAVAPLQSICPCPGAGAGAQQCAVCTDVRGLAQVRRAVLAHECAQCLKDFFRQRRLEQSRLKVEVRRQPIIVHPAGLTFGATDGSHPTPSYGAVRFTCFTLMQAAQRKMESLDTVPPTICTEVSA